VLLYVQLHRDQQLQHAAKPTIAIVHQEWARINSLRYFLFCHQLRSNISYNLDNQIFFSEYDDIDVRIIEQNILFLNP
jgi:hypothetical protein